MTFAAGRFARPPECARYHYVVPNYKRNFATGATFFFTVVTKDRHPVFVDESTVELLRRALRAVNDLRPFTIDAAVILPDHLHMIWTLPPNDGNFDKRWSAIKSRFTRDWLAAGGREAAISDRSARKRHRGVWQHRFFEHTIRNEEDLVQHIDYIHFNPVKHGLVSRPVDWRWSSIHHYIAEGILPPDWGTSGVPPCLDRINPDMLE